MLIHKNGKTYRVRKDGKFDRRYKASRGLTEPKIVGKDMKERKPIKKKVDHRPTFLALFLFVSSFYMAYNITTSIKLAIMNRVHAYQIEKEASKPQLISPVIWSCVADCDSVQESTGQEEATNLEPKKQSFVGEASWYGEEDHECLGCRADRLMANGERFNENARTLAFNHLPLNTEVTVRNLDNGEIIEATVTDTGGFNSLGRIADLSEGLKNLLGCADICNVEVVEK